MKFKIFYKKGGNKNSEKNEITIPSSSISNELKNEINQNEPTIENNFILDDLINNNKLDHTFIEKIFKFNGVEIQLINLNIGRKIGIWQNSFGSISYSMRSKKTLEFINNKDLRTEALGIPRGQQFKDYLRSKNFEQPEFSESIYIYKQRIKSTLIELLKLKKNNLIICLQEIEKFILKDGSFNSICNDLKLNLYGNYDNIYNNAFGTASCILYNFSDEKIKISETESKINNLLKISNLKINDELTIPDPYKINSFDLKISNDDNEQTLSLYNIHTNLYENEDARVLMRNITKYLENKNYIIIGDMNLKLDNVYIYYLTKFFRDIRVNFYLISTPEIEYNIEEYLDGTSPTYDVFISKGISLLN